MTTEDQAGFANSDDQEIDLNAIRKAIRPLLWRVLVCPVQPRKMSKGGIALPNDTQDAEAHLNYIGRVVSMGPLAGKSEKFLNPSLGDGKPIAGRNGALAGKFAWDVKAGDLVTYGRYAGQRMEWKGIKLLEVNDDEILAVVDSLENFRVYAA